MQYKGYSARIEFDEDAQLLHGEVVGLRDVVTFEADAASGLVQAFRDSVDDYLEFCRERGEDPEKPYSGQFVVRVEPSLHRELWLSALSQELSLNAFVKEACAFYLTTLSSVGRESGPLPIGPRSAAEVRVAQVESRR